MALLPLPSGSEPGAPSSVAGRTTNRTDAARSTTNTTNTARDSTLSQIYPPSVRPINFPRFQTTTDATLYPIRLFPDKMDCVLNTAHGRSLSSAIAKLTALPLTDAERTMLVCHIDELQSRVYSFRAVAMTYFLKVLHDDFESKVERKQPSKARLITILRLVTDFRFTMEEVLTTGSHATGPKAARQRSRPAQENARPSSTQQRKSPPNQTSPDLASDGPNKLTIYTQCWDCGSVQERPFVLGLALMDDHCGACQQ
ncbi:hypothetical protein IWX90DRAFT_504129 [Phyllosticta citrichinensis]|uniref:Uncharacterized protein n=1 Tax=Phyllosticta citrichinensis TaxID=1130410 RepID=A0ABR1XUT8_9PEZI